MNNVAIAYRMLLDPAVGVIILLVKQEVVQLDMPYSHHKNHGKITKQFFHF